MCKIDSYEKAAALCDYLGGVGWGRWEGGLREGLIQQKLAKHCKANTLPPSPKKHSCMPQQRPETLCAATNTWHSQISQ